MATAKPSRPRDNRRRLIARAAIDVLGREGSRGFTHRAIDRALSLPDGSTSAYFRRRADLILAVLTMVIDEDLEMLEQHLGELLVGEQAPTVNDVAERIRIFVETIAARAGAHGGLARFECYLLAQRETSLRQRMRELVRKREAYWVAIFVRLGAADAQRSADLFDIMIRGIFYQRSLLAGMSRTTLLGRRQLKRMLAIALQEGYPDDRLQSPD